MTTPITDPTVYAHDPIRGWRRVHILAPGELAKANPAARCGASVATARGFTTCPAPLPSDLCQGCARKEGRK